MSTREAQQSPCRTLLGQVHLRMEENMNSLCVYCGSSMGASPAYQEAAVLLGATLAQRGISLVYGGTSVGLMAALADAVPGKPGLYPT